MAAAKRKPQRDGARTPYFQVDSEPWGPWLDVMFKDSGEGNVNAWVRLTVNEAQALIATLQAEVAYIKELRATRTEAERIAVIRKKYPNV